MNKPENRRLGRVRYWEGQMLRSSDFRDMQRIEAQRRWWHNRALHKAYGAYQGMQAKEVTESGETFIRVAPGVAYDCFGRELVLECFARIAIPSVLSANVKGFTLQARYCGMERRDLTDDRSTTCCLSSQPSSVGTAEFVWSAHQRVSPAEGIPLGRLPYSKGGKPLRFRPFVPVPSQRPLARPRLGAGSTVPGSTVWQPWVYTTLDGNDQPISTEIGVQTTIDTSAAGFTDIPQYFAWLEGPFWNASSLQLVPALLPSLADDSVNSFTFRLILLPPPQGSLFDVRVAAAASKPTINFVQDSNSLSVFAQQQQLYVSWLGCLMPQPSQFVSPEKITCSRAFQAQVLY